MAGNLNCDFPPPAAPVIVPSEIFARTAADYIAQSIQSAGARGHRVTVALSGGTSPRPVYQELARDHRIAWSHVEVFFADERAVTAVSPLSNYRLVSETLGACFSQRPGAIHRMEAERVDLAQAAAEYESILPVELDLLVLGMGEDAVRQRLHRAREMLQADIEGRDGNAVRAAFGFLGRRCNRVVAKVLQRLADHPLMRFEVT